MSAWTLIRHEKVAASGVSEIQFTNISQIYTDLILMYSIRTTRNLFVEDLYLNINGENLDAHVALEGNGSTAGAGSDPSYNNRIGVSSAATSTANTFGSGITHIPNYTAIRPKILLTQAISETNATGGYQFLTASLDTSTSALTSLRLYSGTGNTIVQHSSATLYGITRGSSGGVTVS